MNSILITTSSFGKNDREPLTVLEETFDLVTLNPYGRKLTEDEILKLIREVNPVGIIAGVEPLTRKVLKEAEALRVISRAGIGMDSVDLEAAKELHISVTNTPDAPTIPVAELTIGMILSLLRQLHRSDVQIRSGKWYRPMGNLLHGKSVGLIGCGRIGSHVAKLLAPFGCKVQGCDPACSYHEHIYLTDIKETLKESDIVSLHLPYSESTRHIIDENALNIMRQGAFLINPSRGGLIDEAALYVALKSERIGGAAIDSFEKEPYSGPLTELENILLTGHIGSYAREGRIFMEKQATQNLMAALQKMGTI